jgi:hypothetical protein
VEVVSQEELGPVELVTSDTSSVGHRLAVTKVSNIIQNGGVRLSTDGGTYLLTYGTEPVLKNCKLCNHSRTSKHFMEHVGSLPYSQEPSTSPYPEPDLSSPYHPILSL